MSRARGRPCVSDSARDAAEATLDLDRIRKFGAVLFEKIYLPDAAALDCLAELNDKLAKLARYERRAISKRNRALRFI